MGSIISKDSDDTRPFHSPETNEGRSLLGRPYIHRYDYDGAHTPRPFPTAPVTELVKEARYGKSKQTKARNHDRIGDNRGDTSIAILLDSLLIRLLRFLLHFRFSHHQCTGHISDTRRAGVARDLSSPVIAHCAKIS